MFRSIQETVGYALHAVDGELGRVDDFLFDDRDWVVRYGVVDTRGWLPGRRVLISPESFDEPDWAKGRVPVRLTKQQIRSSPGVASPYPIARQIERELAEYYGWPHYWAQRPPLGVGPPVTESFSADATDDATMVAVPEPHLLSVQEIVGYHLEAVDGPAGCLDDFIVDTTTWAIWYLVVNTGHVLLEKPVLVPTGWLDRINVPGGAVNLHLTRDAIRAQPAFDSCEPVNRDDEHQLVDYYGRPTCWGR